MVKLIKMIKRYPFAFLFTSLAMFLPMQGAILIFNYKQVINLGIYGILIFGILFYIIPILLWVFVAKIHGDNVFYYKQKSNTEFEFNEYVKTWQFSFAVGSFACLMFGLLIMILCLMFNLNLKWFLGLSFLIPTARILFSLRLMK